MQAIGLDHYKVGFKSSEGYTEVLTIVDMASTYVQYIPVRDEKTETTLVTVLTRWIALFGCPEVIFTDLASVFKSSEAQVFYKLLGIDHMVTAPHAHWMLGRVERKHQAHTCAQDVEYSGSASFANRRGFRRIFGELPEIYEDECDPERTNPGLESSERIRGISNRDGGQASADQERTTKEGRD